MNEKSSSLPSTLGLSPIAAAFDDGPEAVDDRHSTLDPLQERWLEEQSAFEDGTESEEEDQHLDDKGTYHKRRV
jgi:hypothetical protein